MPRRSVLSASDRDALLALPESEGDLIRHYTFSETDLALIQLRRGNANRFGFAVQLCLLRYPGVALSRDRAVLESLIQWIARTLWLDSAAWPDDGESDETRREHVQTLLVYLQLKAFRLSDFRGLVHELTVTALQTDKGLVLASRALEHLRENQIVIPSVDLTVVSSAAIVPCWTLIPEPALR